VVAVTSVNDAAYNWPELNNSPDPIQYAPPTHLIDLTVLDPDIKLALNFKLKELMQPEKGQWALFSPAALMRVQKVRESLGVPLYVNSAFRSPGYNAGIDGAAKYSRHQYGDAVDVSTKGATSLTQIKSACEAQGADFTKLYDTHVHCDWRNLPLETTFWQ
jgi:hypothetical protein